MNESIVWALVGFIAGAAISWVLAQSRQRQALAGAAAAALAVSTQLQVELSSLKERASRIPDLERDLGISGQALNAASERKATLEAEVARLPELETNRVRTLEELESASALTTSLRERVSRLTAELAADRDALGSLKLDLQAVKSQLQHKVDETASQSVEIAELRNTLHSERSSSQRSSPCCSKRRLRSVHAMFAMRKTKMYGHRSARNET